MSRHSKSPESSQQGKDSKEYHGVMEEEENLQFQETLREQTFENQFEKCSSNSSPYKIRQRTDEPEKNDESPNFEDFEESSSASVATNKWVESLEYQNQVNEEEQDDGFLEDEEITHASININRNLKEKYAAGGSKEFSIENFQTPSSSMNDISHMQLASASVNDSGDFELYNNSSNSGGENISINTNSNCTDEDFSHLLTTPDKLPPTERKKSEYSEFSTSSLLKGSFTEINKISSSISDLNSADLTLSTPTSPQTPSISNSISSSKPKKKSWYNFFSSSYKSKSNDFKKLFHHHLPKEERLIVDYSCALQKEILIQGRMYISQNYVSFYANIFGYITQLCMKLKDIRAITKEKTALVIPNAIQIQTETEKYFFSSYVTRDSTYLLLFKIWQNNLIEDHLSSKDILKLIQSCYGEELGITSEEETEEFLRSKSLLAPDMSPCSVSLKSVEEDFETKSFGIEQEEIYNAAAVALGVALGSDISRTPNLSLKHDHILLQEDGKELPTDQSDSSDSDGEKSNERPISLVPSIITVSPESPESPDSLDFLDIPECPFDHTLGRETVNTIINTDVDSLFTMLFTNSKFYMDLHQSRKTFDIVLSPWSQADNKKMRQVSFTVTLNQLMGPKHSQVTETQIMLPESVPGKMYSVDCESVNSGIPYADSFYVTSHFCLTRVSGCESKLRIVNQIKYKKSVWGMKPFIEKNSWAGIVDFYSHLERALKEECIKAFDLSPSASPSKKIIPGAGAARRRARKKGPAPGIPYSSTNLSSTQNGIIPNTLIDKAGLIAKASQTITEGTVILKAILTILCFLILLNAFLYFKLTQLEYSALNSPLLFPQKFQLSEGEIPQNHEEWLHLLQHQESLHRLELEKWHGILVSALKILNQAETDLGSLKSHISVYGQGKINSPGKLKEGVIKDTIPGSSEVN